jgi:hypothetical protein
MFIFDPESGFFPSQIPDARSKNINNNKKEEKKINSCLTFFVAINFTKLKIIFFLSGTGKV